MRTTLLITSLLLASATSAAAQEPSPPSSPPVALRGGCRRAHRPRLRGRPHRRHHARRRRRRERPRLARDRDRRRADRGHPRDRPQLRRHLRVRAARKHQPGGVRALCADGPAHAGLRPAPRRRRDGRGANRRHPRVGLAGRVGVASRRYSDRSSYVPQHPRGRGSGAGRARLPAPDRGNRARRPPARRRRGPRLTPRFTLPLQMRVVYSGPAEWAHQHREVGIGVGGRWRF